ncbi:hypothetical protein EOM57_03160 [Candidatus Saccharibacteria bacterium]|nr:hypothetical protein [Candidatus Saccharibacteria bacterium]
MSQKKQLIYSQLLSRGILLVLSFLMAGTLLSVSTSTTSYASTDCSDVFTPLSTYVIDGVNINKQFYINTMNQTGVPWEMLAAIHYRETNFSHINPANGQGIFQFVNGDGGPYPPGPVSDEEFNRQLTFMASRIQADYALRNVPNPASVIPRQLTPNEQDVTLIKNTLYSYNGRADAYAAQAIQYGFDPNTQPYEGSPYVMNRYDCSRARMGIITRDYVIGIDSTDTRYGAFTIFARLKGDSYWLSSFSPYSWASVSQEAYSNPDRTSSFTMNATAEPGGNLYMRIKARNIGSQSWNSTSTSIRVGTTSPFDRRSIFEDSTWVTPVRPASQTEITVDPGQIATFDFVLKAPTQTGSYREYFSIVNDGVTWLNNPGLYFPIDVVTPVSSRNTLNIDLKENESLKINEYILSPDAQSSLVLEENGNLVYYSSLRKVWASNTVGSDVDRLIMQPDGNLVLYSNTDIALWYSGSFTDTGNVRLVIQSDGNMVVYDDQSAIWSIGYINNPNLYSTVSTKMSSSRMFPLQVIETADRKYQLTLQPDGNLVLYNNSKPIWSTMTIGNNPAKYLQLQPDGNLVLYDKNNLPLWSSKTEGNGESMLIVQNDGNVVLYKNNTPTWSSDTFGR